MPEIKIFKMLITKTSPEDLKKFRMSEKIDWFVCLSETILHGKKQMSLGLRQSRRNFEDKPLIVSIFTFHSLYVGIFSHVTH